MDTIVECVEGTDGGDETEDTCHNSTTGVVARDGNGQQQHEEELAESQDEQWDGGLEGGHEEEEVEHGPTR